MYFLYPALQEFQVIGNSLNNFFIRSIEFLVEFINLLVQPVSHATNCVRYRVTLAIWKKNTLSRLESEFIAPAKCDPLTDISLSLNLENKIFFLVYKKTSFVSVSPKYHEKLANPSPWRLWVFRYWSEYFQAQVRGSIKVLGLTFLVLFQD